MDLDQFEERSAILEYDEGMVRFAAETEAARRQGFKRWEILDAIKRRNSEGSQNHGSTGIRHTANDMPGVQPHAAQEDRPVSGGHIQPGRDSGVLSPLWVGVREVIR